MPRVISGSARGTRLSVPRGRTVRPTADRVKEALFSILTPVWPPDSFLDLYAGSGQIGLEAASRGARQVTLVENSPLCLHHININRQRTHLESVARVIQGEVACAVKRLLLDSASFDIIFIDPPYKHALSDFIRLSGSLAGLLSCEGQIILEHGSEVQPPQNVTNLKFARCCQYGSAMLSFYKRDKANPDRSSEPGC